jgi:hypothetical protein
MSQESGVFNELLSKLSKLSPAIQAVIVALLLLFPAILLLWVADKIFLYYLTRSYVDELSYVLNINIYYAKALSLLVFMATVFFVGKIGLSSRGRLIGVWGLVGLLVAHSLLMGFGIRNQFFDRSGKAIKCYVITREGDVRFLEHAGIDPETGRQCRNATPEMLERLTAYKNGRRPRRLADSEADVFYELRTGEPIIWYSRAKSGEIQLFNLMGFHPDTGAELLPVTPDIVEVFMSQRAERQQRAVRRQRRPPQQVDPETYQFFNPATGEPQVWYWQDPEGSYEFFDAQGFHPSTGEPLKPVDGTTLGKWRRQKADKENREKQEFARKEQEERDRIAREERDRQAAVEQVENERKAAAARDAREQQAAQELQQKIARAGASCDDLAGNPSDTRKSSASPGSRYENLREHFVEALDVCKTAIDNMPGELRYRYQYARALEISEPEKAIPLYRDLIRQNYPAAFDNLGNVYIRKKDMRAAISVLKAGVRAGDPDSMVTMADLIERGYAPVQNPAAAKYALLERAAQLGHSGAQLAIAQKRAEMQQQQQERAFQQQEQQMMLDLFGTIVRGVAR